MVWLLLTHMRETAPRFDFNERKLADEIAARLRALPVLKTEAIRSLRREYSKLLTKAQRTATLPSRRSLMLGRKDRDLRRG